MIIQVSEKHAEGEYGDIVSDIKMKLETIAYCHPWKNYIIIKDYSSYVHYVHLMTSIVYSQDASCYDHKAFKKNTVITFTQDKLL